MRKHLNDYLFSPLSWLLTIILIFLLLLVLLFLTPMGAKLLAKTADLSFSELTIKGVTGSLFTGLNIDEIIWEDGDSIGLKNVELKMQYYNSKKGRLVAKNVSAERLNINLINKARSSDDIVSLPNFGLPLNMNAHLVELDSLSITQDVPGDIGSRTLLFQVKNIQLKKVTIDDGYLRYRRLQGSPIIMGEPLVINVSEGKLNMDRPHDIKTSGAISYQHDQVGEVEGEIKLSGTLTNYDFEGEINHKNENIGDQRISLAGEGDYKRVHLRKVTLKGAHGEAEGKGRILWDPEITWAFIVDGENLSTERFLPDWPATINTQFRYGGNYIDSRLENNINILSLKGNLREYDLKLTGQMRIREGVITTDNLDLTVGDNQLQVSGRANEPFDLQWKIDANNINQLLPENLSKIKLAGAVKGNGELKGRIKTPILKADLVAKGLAYEEFRQGSEDLLLKGEAFLENDVVLLKDFSLQNGENTLELTGQASEPADIKWSFNARQLKQINSELSGNIKASGGLKGAYKQPQLDFELAANNLGYKALKQNQDTLSLEGKLSFIDNLLQIDKLNAISGSNKVVISGQAAEPLNLDIKITAENLKQVSIALNGRIIGEAKVTGKFATPTVKMNTTISNLGYQNFKLAETERLTVNGEVQLIDNIPIIREMRAQIGSNRLMVSGRASTPFDLNLNLEGNNLQLIMPQLMGSINAKGQLRGTIEQPILNGNLDAKNLRYKEFSLALAKFNASTNGGNYLFKGDLASFENKGQKIDSGQFELKGRVENHAIKVSVDHEQGKVDMQANGRWQQQRWQGTVNSLSINNTEVGDWRLQSPTALTVSQEGFNSSQFCFKNDQMLSCASASWSKTSGVTAKGTLKKTPLSMFKPWLPRDLSLNGTVDGSFVVQQNNGKPLGKVRFSLPDSTFSIKDSEGEERIFAYKQAELNASIKNRAIDTDLNMMIVDRGKLSAKATINLSPENGKHTIDGNAELDIPNIYFAQQLIPRSRGLQGSFNSKLSFIGPLNKPRIKGRADIKNAYLRLPEAGTEITNINIQLRADTPGQAKLNGKMFMGKGALTVSGDMDIRDIAKWKANINLNGNNIRFMNTNEITATMTPDVKVSITPDVVSITGKVIIPEAEVRLKDIPETSIDESSDTFVIGESKKGENVSAVKIKPNVTIQLGDKVRINAFGLKAKLSGDVRITNNRRDVLANGSLRVTDGKYQAYGQLLDINNGRLIFNGSPKIVGMDIRATRKVDDTIVGVHLGGTLLKPKSKIFSDPTLPESEALSYLITGHSLSTASGRESALLLSAVRGLGITGSGSLIQNIGSSFGLDDVNIVTKQDLRASELSLGKRLGPRLYVRYLVGLFDQTQKIAVEYKINKFLSLEAQTSADEYGLDFIYEIERN